MDYPNRNGNNESNSTGGTQQVAGQVLNHTVCRIQQQNNEVLQQQSRMSSIKPC